MLLLAILIESNRFSGRTADGSNAAAARSELFARQRSNAGHQASTEATVPAIALPDSPTPANPKPQVKINNRAPRSLEPTSRIAVRETPLVQRQLLMRERWVWLPSRPAGAAIASAKQRRVRVILISVGVIAGAAIAGGTVAALSHASPGRP